MTGKIILCRAAGVLSWSYLFLLAAWLAAYLAFGDRIGYLGLLNLVAVNLFYPLPLVLLTSLLCRSRGLAAGFGLGALAFLALWGASFMPRPARARSAGPELTVMTFNVLAWHQFTGPIIETIRAENPDIVFIQELNRGLAHALQTELADIYPYQALQPVDNPSGIGTLSRYPIQPAGERLPTTWIGGPVVTTMEWQGQAVTLINFHMYPTTGLRSSQAAGRDFRTRAEQARLLAGLARRSGPTILGGDANSVPISDAYNILTGGLGDAWREAGFGLGHTFPGSTVPGSDRPKIGPWYVPPWLARIDYIFHTKDWEVVSARLARVDGVSDHRGVVAVLRLKK